MLRAFVPVIPYIVIVFAVVGFYKFGLDTQMDEFTAPVILPIMLLAFILFDKIFGAKLPVPENPKKHWHLSMRNTLSTCKNM